METQESRQAWEDVPLALRLKMFAQITTQQASTNRNRQRKKKLSMMS